MTEETEKLSPAEALAARERQLTYQHVLAIEGNPLDAGDVAMFEMFEREGWTHEQCRAYIIEQARKAAAGNARHQPDFDYLYCLTSQSL